MDEHASEVDNQANNPPSRWVPAGYDLDEDLVLVLPHSNLWM